METANEGPVENKSYLFYKKTFLLILKWIAYFPIQHNFGLTEFKSKFLSITFILQSIKVLIVLALFTSSRYWVVYFTVTDTHLNLKKKIDCRIYPSLIYTPHIMNLYHLQVILHWLLQAHLWIWDLYPVEI